MQNRIICFLLSLLPTISVDAQDVRVKDGKIFVGKNPVAKFIAHKIPINRNNYEILNLNDSALFQLKIVKKEYWVNGPYEEFYQIVGKGVDSAVHISYKHYPTLEELASLIVQGKLIQNNRMDTAAMRSFAKTHSLQGFEERKAKALEVLFENDSAEAALPVAPEIVFEPAFEQNTILKENDYAIHHRDRHHIGYLRMKELDMDGTKDYRVSILNASKFESAIITYRYRTGYKAASIFVRRDRSYHNLETDFTLEGLQKAALYLIKNGLL